MIRSITPKACTDSSVEAEQDRELERAGDLRVGQVQEAAALHDAGIDRDADAARRREARPLQVEDAEGCRCHRSWRAQGLRDSEALDRRADRADRDDDRAGGGQRERRTRHVDRRAQAVHELAPGRSAPCPAMSPPSPDAAVEVQARRVDLEHAACRAGRCRRTAGRSRAGRRRPTSGSLISKPPTHASSRPTHPRSRRPGTAAAAGSRRMPPPALELVRLLRRCGELELRGAAAERLDRAIAGAGAIAKTSSGGSMLSCRAGPSAIGAAIASTDSTAATKLGGSVSVPRMVDLQGDSACRRCRRRPSARIRCSTFALAPNAAAAAADGDSFALSRTLAVETTRGPVSAHPRSTACFAAAAH